MSNEVYTIKEASNILNITPQAIYKRQKELIQKGFMIINRKGKYKITDAGLHYLAGVENIQEIRNFHDGMDEASEFWKSRVRNKIYELEVRIEVEKEQIKELKRIIYEL